MAPPVKPQNGIRKVESNAPVFVLFMRLLWAAALVLSAFGAQAGLVLTTLHSFQQGFPNGANPFAGLVQASDGNFYGTTYDGGTNNFGTVFKISTEGAFTSLYSFTIGLNDGVGPRAGLVQGSDGNFYGTTTLFYGEFLGTVFQITSTGVLTALESGLTPWSSALVQGRDGSFYGTSELGGQGNAGTVFRLTIVPDPQLTLIPSGPNLILTWPTNAGAFSYAGYTLQSTTNLGPSAVWSTNSPGPVVIGGQNVVIKTISGTQQFFRLSH
jgi:uncharacterized repeat protein (TIGR03803 family)